VPQAIIVPPTAKHLFWALITNRCSWNIYFHLLRESEEYWPAQWGCRCLVMYCKPAKSCTKICKISFLDILLEDMVARKVSIKLKQPVRDYGHSKTQCHFLIDELILSRTRWILNSRTMRRFVPRVACYFPCLGTLRHILHENSGAQQLDSGYIKWSHAWDAWG